MIHRLFRYLLLLPLLTAQVAVAQSRRDAFTRSSFNRVIITETDHPNPEEALPSSFIIDRPAPASFLSLGDNPDRATLSAAEADTLYRRLMSPKSYRHGAAICFEPRLDIFFLKNDTLINHVAVCLDCNRLRADAGIRAAEWPADGLNPKGLTAGMRRYLSALITRHGFEHGIDGSSIWDRP